MNRFPEKSTAPLYAYNPWVVSVDHGHFRQSASAARRGTTGTSVVARALQKVRSALQRGSA